MEKGKLYFTVGLPRSGKSTFCERWVKAATRDMRQRVIIGGDDFRTAIHGCNFIPEAEGLVFASMDIAARALLNRGFDVIIDDTCTSEATLLRYLRIDRDATPQFFWESAKACECRAIATKKDFLIGPINRMAPQLEHFLSNYEEISTRLLTYLKNRETHDVKC